MTAYKNKLLLFLRSMMIFMLLAVGHTGAVSAAAGAPISFDPAVSYPVGSESTTVAMADFNHDGKLDLVVTNLNSDSVSVLLGTGSGSFSSATNYILDTFQGTAQFPARPLMVATGDLNGDGKLDLITADNFSGYILTILFGNGDGTFQEPAQRITKPSTGYETAFYVAIGDLNGDGKPDLVTTNFTDSLSVLLGNGAGSFSALPNIAVGINPKSVAIGDLNGDGKPDLVMANLGDNTISVLIGNGDGTFGPLTSIAVGTTPESLAIGDLNGDSKPDLVVANESDNNVSVLPGNGDGTFGAATNFTVGSNPSSVVIGDLNGDGNPDLATTNSGDSANPGSVSVLLGNGDGSFGAVRDFTVGVYPLSLAIGDLNSDGKPDMVTANSTLAGTISVLLATTCAAGQYDTGNGCMNAAPGYYVPLAGATTQIPCALGTYQPSSGATSCIPTPPGTFNNTAAATSATLCPAGLYQSNAGSVSCIPTPTGTYVSAMGAVSPTLCPAGYYQPGSGSVSCIAASAGYFVDNAGMAAQILCPKGTYQPNSGSTSCFQAPAGSYVSTTGATSAALCAPGTYQPNTGAASCILADAGFYVPAPAAIAQIACASGFTSAAGATACTPLVVGQTITFAALPDKTYGDPDFTVSATVSSGLTVTFTTGSSDQCTISGNTVHITGAGSCTVTSHQAGNTNYTAAPDVARTFTIVKAALTITADNKNKIYDSANPVLTVSYSSFVNGETPASLDVPVILATTATTTSPVGTFPIIASGAATANYNITFVSGTLTVTAASTSLLYNGGQLVNLGSTFQPAGLLSSAAPACVSNQQVRFSLDANPISGVAGPYLLGNATTNASGQATMATVSTTGWLQGTYNITAEFTGTVNCAPSVNSAPLTVTQTGNIAFGVGYYALPGSGQVEFGFAVGKTNSQCNLNCTYKGQLLLENDNKWMLKGSLNSYSKLGSGKAVSTGVGSLFWWKASLNNGHGGWVLAAQSVNFTITYFDSNQPLKLSTDTFGINIQYTPVTPQPAVLPNSDLTILKGGDIVVK